MATTDLQSTFDSTGTRSPPVRWADREGRCPEGGGRPSLSASVAQVFSFNLLAQMVTGAAGILIIHFMPAAEYARFTVALSLVVVSSQIVSGGFNRVYVAGCREMGLHARPSEFLGLQLLVLLVVSLILIPAAYMFGGPCAAVLLAFVGQCLAEYAQSLVQQELRFLRYAVVLLVRALVLLMAVLVLAVVAGPELQAWQVLVAQGVTLLGVFAGTVAGRIRPAGLVNVSEIARLGASVLRGRYGYLFGYFIVIAVFAQIDVWTLKAMTDDLSVATYGTAFRYYSLLLMVLGAVHVVLLAQLQELRTLEEFKTVFAKQRRMVALFLPAVALGAWLSQWIIPWIDQGRYPHAVTVFRILCAQAVVAFAYSPYVNVVIRFRDFRFLFAMICASVPAYAVLCVALICAYGVRGAAAAMFISYSIVNASVYWRARDLMRRGDLQLA